jgi:hypothetical protein
MNIEIDESDEIQAQWDAQRAAEEATARRKASEKAYLEKQSEITPIGAIARMLVIAFFIGGLIIHAIEGEPRCDYRQTEYMGSNC